MTRARLTVVPVLLLWLSACELSQGAWGDLGQSVAPVVYGEDNRQEVYQQKGATFNRATQSLVALIEPDQIDGRSVDPEPLRVRYGLCEGEAFAEQPAAAGCSGVLVADDLVLTAGHCFCPSSESTCFWKDHRCDDYSYVFDYYYSRRGQSLEISDVDVYGCKRLVALERRTLASGERLDFAVIQLDRKVDGRRRRAPFRMTSVALGERLTVMGFPTGLPAKVDSGGVVRSNLTGDGFFFADTDTFKGSSGSPVYDADLELVGLVISGETDYETDPKLFCARTKKLKSETGNAGEYERIYPLISSLGSLCADPQGRSTEVCAPSETVQGEVALQCTAQPFAVRSGWLALGLLGLSLCRFRWRTAKAGRALGRR